MTQYPPPPPTDYPAPEGYMAGPPPMSKAAVTGFVFSLLVCLPGIHGLLGVIFGTLGVVNTAGGRMRGRGLAIAAIPLSVIVGSMSSLGAYGMFVFGKFGMEMAMLGPKLEPVFVAASADPGPAVARLRGLASDSFNRAYSDDDLKAWLGKIAKDYGAATKIMPASGQPAPSTGQALTMSYPATFVNKNSARVNVAFDASGESFSAKLVGIDVDGMKPEASTPSPEPAAPPTEPEGE